MTPILFGQDGRPIRLSNRLGKGGEGEVYAIEGSGDVAVKFYTIKDPNSREGKVRRMVESQLASKTKFVAFPISLVFDKVKKFAGFTMPRVSAHKALHELYSPGARKKDFPQANYRFLVLTAANIARAIGSAHALGCVVGDINHSGILISPHATVSLIDADSFQVSDGAKHYPCKVGVPEYTPPELQGKAFGSLVRTSNHDAFGLAVAIFQLLFMGRHPFSGTYSSGDMPLERAISEFRFAYSVRRKVGMVPPPGVPTLNDFPAEVGAAFEAAFSPEGVQSRPSAKQWIALLDALAKSLKVCSKSPLHHYPVAASECPWCRMEVRFAVLLFVPTLEALASAGSFKPTLGDVLAIWRAIEAVQPPAKPPFPDYWPEVAASLEATEQKDKRRSKQLVGAVLIFAAAIIPFLWSGVMLISFALVGCALWALISKSAGDDKIIEKYKKVVTAITLAEVDWNLMGSGHEFYAAKAKLSQLKEQFDALPGEERKRLDEYSKNRRSAQLKDYLEGFQIRKFKIPKIGTGRQAILLSYGIETAADVNEVSVLRVPGFGERTAQPLFNWRRHLEARFVYNASPTAADKAADLQIRNDVSQKGARLRLELSTGPAKLAQISLAINAQRNVRLPSIEALLKERAQCLADVKELGAKLPDIRSMNFQTPQPRPQPISAPSASTANTSNVTASPVIKCPDCSGNMVIRLATRGRHRGNKFYGCVRYPACKGTRSFP